MNDPLSLGARGEPLSRPSPSSVTLARPFHPLFQPTRRRLRRDPFHSLFAGLTTHFYLRSSPFDHRHPLAILLLLFFLLHSKQHPSLSNSRRHSPSLLCFHSRSLRKLIMGRVTLAISLSLTRTFTTLSFFVLQESVEGDDRAGMIARAKFQGQCTSPGIERASLSRPSSDLFFPKSHVLALVFKNFITFYYILYFSTLVFFLSLLPID